MIGAASRPRQRYMLDGGLRLFVRSARTGRGDDGATSQLTDSLRLPTLRSHTAAALSRIVVFGSGRRHRRCDNRQYRDIASASKSNRGADTHNSPVAIFIGRNECTPCE